MQDTNELRLSVSKTKCFSQCKKQFEFNYIKKLPKKDRDYHVFGKFCHKVLEDFHLYYLGDGTEPYNKVMGDCFKNALKEYNLTAQMKKDCWDIIHKYLILVTKQKNDPNAPKVIACEKEFNLKIADNVIIRGMVDRIQVDGDGVLHVVDYKTTQNKKYLKNDFFQLLTYSFVLISENPEIKKVRGSYILLKHDFEYITTEFDVDQIMSVKDEYLKYANDMFAEKEYAPSPSALCDFCDFLEVCPPGLAKSRKYNRNVDLTSYGETTWE